jgi:HK97 family phage major capsid protein
MELDQATVDILEDVRTSVTAIRSGSEKRDRDVAELKSRVDAMAFTGSGSSGFAGGETRDALWLPGAREFKAQSISSGDGGGYLVPEQNADLFFDRLRPQSVVLAAGPLRYQMKTDREVIPGINTSVTAYNPGEGGTITDSSIVFQTVALASRKYASRSIGSAEWFSDANPDARRLVQQDHERQLAAALDRDMLQGDGINKLLGFRHVPGATVTTLGGGAGAVITLDDVLAAIGRMEAANAKPSAIFCHPRDWTNLREEKDAANGRYQLTPDPSGEAPRRLFGVPVFVSSQISTTESPGGGDSSSVFLVDMSRVVVGVRSLMTVLFDPFSRSSTDQIVINTTTRWAMAVIDAAAVQVIAGCQP